MGLYGDGSEVYSKGTDKPYLGKTSLKTDNMCQRKTGAS